MQEEKRGLFLQLERSLVSFDYYFTTWDECALIVYFE